MNVLAEREGLQRVELDGGRRAYVLTKLTGPVAVGDRVVVNTTAVTLGLGTGGWDVVHWNLARERWSEPGPGHVMKLRYTSLQVDVGSAEEQLTTAGRHGLDGRPVIVCVLHSQVACAAAAFKHLLPARRVVFVMTDWGALPVALSDLLADLRAAGLVEHVVSAGQAFGGDDEAVNVTSGLEVAASLAGADAIVVGPGPGLIGTATELGFSGLEVAAVVDATAALGGSPIVAVRFSDADRRPRHQGVSHHSVTALARAHSPAVVPLPRGRLSDLEDDFHRVVEVDVPDMGALLGGYGLRVTTMGRGPREDPGFFTHAGAAGVVAAELLSG
jgi:hypothetical protein